MPLSQALQKLTEVRLLTALTPRPPPQPIPPQFRMDLHCAYHQGPKHETDRCTALRASDAHSIPISSEAASIQATTSETLTFTRRQVPFVLLDNGSVLNVCHLAIAIALGYAPFDFGPSTQTVRTYDSTRREVMGILGIELLIGPATFVTVFQVLRIPTSFNLLLGRPWIHRAGVIPSSLHQNVKFIHDGHVVVVQSVGDMFVSAEPERVRAQLTHTPFYYPIRPYIMSLANYFVRASESHAPSDGIIGELSTTQETELQRLVQQLRLSDGAPGPSTSTLITPSSLDRTSLMTLCFLDEIDEHKTLAEIIDIVDGVVPHDEYIDEMLAMSMSQIDQILMAPKDMEKTSFIIEWGTYCYRVMPFGLKNAGATYQRAATTLFHDMMHRDVEVYVDDMIVKSRDRSDHLAALKMFFERIRQFRLRLNPKKCTFGVTSGKLLGYMKSIRGSIVADHLASLPVFDGRAIDDDFPDKDVAAVTSLSSWSMYFDGATNHSGYGIGVLLISPHGDRIPRSVRLAFSDQHPATNNIVEYEACILGLETALELRIR
uniref:Reverse transcriptase domain-containing protein n=1 Tax=Vitis vinifera TaxID=29760 RepID=A5C4G1_VITVI|nr:hypothetical protein VITISV_042654 [Vitis vinifera]